VAPYMLFAALVIGSGDWAVLVACVALAVATLLFIFYIQPDASDLAALYAILDDRDRPYYEHRLAA